MNKAKIFYFAVFILAVFALVFHLTAMGHHRWKRADRKTSNNTFTKQTTIGLFERCESVENRTIETCFPNKFPMSGNCFNWSSCLPKPLNDTCQCDFLPSTKGIASCAIIASVFLGFAIILLFIHSIKSTETRSIGLCLSFFPLILLLLGFIFILITLILVGCYLSRDMMYIVRTTLNDNDINVLRNRVSTEYDVRIDWATGLDIVALVLTFFSFILYTVFVFKVGRSS